jgi:hypothetical protein
LRNSASLSHGAEPDRIVWKAAKSHEHERGRL